MDEPRKHRPLDETEPKRQGSRPGLEEEVPGEARRPENVEARTVSPGAGGAPAVQGVHKQVGPPDVGRTAAPLQAPTSNERLDQPQGRRVGPPAWRSSPVEVACALCGRAFSTLREREWHVSHEHEA
jgi:hypothetical protein